MIAIYLKLIRIIRINQNLKMLDGKLVLKVYSYFLIVFFMIDYLPITKIRLKIYKYIRMNIEKSRRICPFCPASDLGSFKAAR